VTEYTVLWIEELEEFKVLKSKGLTEDIINSMFPNGYCEYSFKVNENDIIISNDYDLSKTDNSLNGTKFNQFKKEIK
jgi:hypothetical protein